MVFLQFLAGHLVKLRWRLSTPHQLKWSGVHRCPPSSTVRSEGTRCTMSGWLMGSPQDSQPSRTSWLMMPRYNTPTPPSATTTSETHNVFLTHNYKLLLCKPDYLFSLVVTCFATNENSVGHTSLFICMWMIISAFSVNILWKNCI